MSQSTMREPSRCEQRGEHLYTLASYRCTVCGVDRRDEEGLEVDLAAVLRDEVSVARREAAEVLARYGHGHAGDVLTNGGVRFGVHWHAQKNTAPGSPERAEVDAAYALFRDDV